MRWLGNAVIIAENRHACKILVGKPEGERPLGRSRCRWENGEAPLGYSGRTALRREQCNVDGQSIARQRLSKHVTTQATVECVSLLGNEAPMNSPASEAKRSDRCYGMMR
jgi:hypothetical protein